ncbi:MAG: aldehyde dehydrogenase family protein [Desulfobacterales bacterium]|nr:aldehyde dehydrogenase family protein [Desulfobacterales bacterium]
MRAYDKFYIDGQWVAPVGQETVAVINPCNEEEIARLAMGNAEDVNRAVAAARSAFGDWSATPASERAALLTRICEAMTARQNEIGDTIAREMGMPAPWSRMIQAGLPIATFASFAQILKDYEFETPMGGTQIAKEAVGVCGFITPWNYPLHQIVGKVAPALAAGCTMILKPSQLAPLNAFILAEILDEVGLPPGVFNLVCGAGTRVGEAMSAHPDVDMVSITGSTASGIHVARAGAETVKRITLELGGKSANILLDDVDFQAAVTKGVYDCFLNSGQTCSALTRMLVPREKQSEVMDIARETVKTMVIGDAFAEGTYIGPVVDAAQQRSVQGYIQKGIDQGATLVTGGAEPPEGLETGYFVKPTVFADVTPEMTIAREEIFGPVLSIMPYGSEDEAVAMANDSPYGLSGAVWSADMERARRVARRMRTGQVYINGAGFDINAPFGGYKQSGNGRERSHYGLEEFLEIKAMMGHNQ